MNVILLGSPGAGKGTQAELLASRFGMVHISTGDLFRAHAREGTHLGKLAKSYMDRGELVPDEVTIAMLRDRLEHEDARAGAIFDGFPRNLAQAQALDRALDEGGSRVDRVVMIEISDAEAVRRLSSRWLCRACGAIYNSINNFPSKEGVCDRCGGELYQRDDDKPEVVARRLDQMKPAAELLEYYQRQSKLVTLDGEDSVAGLTERLARTLDGPSGD
jgi:adenylate kinase